MTISRIRGICRICGKNRVFGNEEKKLCKECSKKYQDGVYTDADIVQRVQGRRPKLVPAPAEDAEAPLPEKPQPKTNNDRQPEKKVYRCEHCSKVVRYGQQKCGHCGQWLSWLHTTAEEDPDLIICPECGTSLGTAAKHSNVCPKCNYGQGSEW